MWAFFIVCAILLLIVTMFTQIDTNIVWGIIIIGGLVAGAHFWMQSVGTVAENNDNDAWNNSCVRRSCRQAAIKKDGITPMVADAHGRTIRWSGIMAHPRL